MATKKKLQCSECGEDVYRTFAISKPICASCQREKRLAQKRAYNKIYNATHSCIYHNCRGARVKGLVVCKKHIGVYVAGTMPLYDGRM